MIKQPKPNGLLLSRITFALSIITTLYWFLADLRTVYLNKTCEAVIEFLWLPMLIFLFALPIFSAIMWIREKFRLRSVYFFSFLVSVLAFVLLMW